MTKLEELISISRNRCIERYGALMPGDECDFIDLEDPDETRSSIEDSIQQGMQWQVQYDILPEKPSEAWLMTILRKNPEFLQPYLEDIKMDIWEKILDTIAPDMERTAEILDGRRQEAVAARGGYKGG